MKRRRSFFVWTVVALAIVGVFLSVRRIPHDERCIITNTRSRQADVHLAFELGYMTETFVTLEGGTFGGVLKPEEPVDIRDDLPGLTDYDPQKQTVLWLYGYVPRAVVRESDWLGAKRLEIATDKGTRETIYYCTLPASIGRGVANVEIDRP